MNELEAKITAEISRTGPIPFARFMQMCLYTPVLGYYEGSRPIGKSGDFYTSVSVGSLFGELLGTQIATWLGACPAPLQLVEAAAHDGRLAADILVAIHSHHREIFDAVQYWIVEPSPARMRIQQQQLSRFGTKVQWFSDLDSLPEFDGVLFANELLDAFPVHRVVWNADKQEWLESCVQWTGNHFAWQLQPLTFRADEIDLPKELLAHLPDQFVFEIVRSAIDWWRQAARKLRSGKLVTFDYGYTLEELLRSGKTTGTLRAYSEHRVTDTLLSNIGQQDITAHVNFDAIAKAGESQGLRTDTLTTQSQFLTEIFKKMISSSQAATWSSKTTKQFQTLTGPEHLGRFRVLVQSR